MKMKMKTKTLTIIITMILLILISCPVYGYDLSKLNFDPMTNEDWNWQLGVTLITTFDIYQTGIGLEHGSYEASPFVVPFIGEHPTKKELYEFGCKWIIVNGVVSYILPKDLRRAWQISCFSITFFETADSLGTRIVFTRIL